MWHIKYVPEIHNDDKGASLLAVHTLKGKDILRFLDVNVMIPQNEDNVRMYNASFYVSPDIPKIENFLARICIVWLYGCKTVL